MLAHTGTGPRVAAVLALGGLLTLKSTVAHAQDDAPSPFDSDFPDPFVIGDGGMFYAFASGARGRNVQVARSRDLTSWESLPDALPSVPSWVAPVSGMTWAPSVLRRGRNHVLYYTAPDAASGFQCISRATARRPEGPYVDDSSRPFICQTGTETPFCGSIDPSPYIDEAGRPWLLWKSDQNHPSCRTPSRIWSQPLSEDGLSIIGSPAPLLTTDQTWEGPLIEGPSMIRDGNTTLLFYSAHSYDSASYAVGYARCSGPMGPCKKVTLDSPLMKSSGSMLGPGGQELFTDPLGRTWMAYHAWTAPNASYRSGGMRSLRLAKVVFSNGVPIVVASPRPRRPS
jgi:beta-xylosidase